MRDRAESNGAGALIVGAGPAGLVAAERLAGAGLRVVVADQMPSPGRKFLLAGRGGLNLTHNEDLERLLSRFGAARARLEPAIRAFPPEALRAWCEGLGQTTFVGSSGRVFPAAMKAAPLLRAWLRRLDRLGVEFRPRHRWTGWTEHGAACFETPAGPASIPAAATLFALGGASWPRMGSDGGWVEAFRARGSPVASLRPSNCGVLVPWSPVFRERFAGEPLKRIALHFQGEAVRGEAMVTRDGLEGGAVYALSARLRDAGEAALTIDLRPDLDLAALQSRLAAPRRGQSTSNFLRRAAGLPPVAIGLLREAPGWEADLAGRIKAAPLRVTGVQPIARAISSAGGIEWSGLDDGFMLRGLPGVFAAGEMLDWEAPTGGYLLQACFATGHAAAEAMLCRLAT